MICAVIASGLPQPDRWKRGPLGQPSSITPRLSVFAPPHPPLGTQNEVPIAMCIKLSRRRKGQSRYQPPLGVVQSLCPAASPLAFPAGNALLTIPYIFMAISPSGLEISFKNFFKIFIFQGNLLFIHKYPVCPRIQPNRPQSDFRRRFFRSRNPFILCQVRFYPGHQYTWRERFFNVPFRNCVPTKNKPINMQF